MGRRPLIKVGYLPDMEVPAFDRWAPRSPVGKILEASRQGAPRRVALDWAGVSRTTFWRWFVLARDHLEDDPLSEEHQVFVDFWNAFTWAGAAFEVELCALWTRAARNDWRAARDLLDAKHPGGWGTWLDEPEPVRAPEQDPWLDYNRRLAADPEALKLAQAIDDALAAEERSR